RSSGGYLLDEPPDMTPSFPRTGVSGHAGAVHIRTVDVHVRRLRAKLGAEHESMIDTVRGVGYMAVTPPQPRWIISESILNRCK
ncbi:winged helix-turn-helix domain-containing protein, partial [Mycobacterium tuberculosis]|uniref:winged helix-turn-helix domain-containing protein n=1 Tax=Mycobacterium tuberculosis TaxID=1773 RepID=UPI0004F2A27F